MSHGPSRHKIDQENARRKAEREFEQAKLDAANKAYALEIIAKFNDRARPDRVPAFFPTIRCVIVADTPIIETVCPACGMITHTDLRHKRYKRFHPLATVAMVVAKVECARCGDNAPFARITRIRGDGNTPVYKDYASTWGMMPPSAQRK